ncbi:MAG: hypothetical protein CL529_11975 [Aequorivita sp.]|nr:hypothetical protein [Aequorivita sp.]|tara:strand:+ start:29801 stop:29980 length:180 start_codon:yes stop_codon:yes gene_type:complete
MKRASHWYAPNGVAQITAKKIKWCNKCKENHPATWFGQDLERTDGLSNKCSKKLREKNQ